jgi:hypothetical protein
MKNPLDVSFARRILHVLVFSLLVAPIASSQKPLANDSKISTEQLIDDLTLINSPAPGLNGGGIYEGFIGDNSETHFVGGVLGGPPPTVPPQMQQLVRRGVAALPALLAHLDDKRSTGLAVGNNMRQVGINAFSVTEFEAEYDPCDEECKRNWSQGRSFQGQYKVKVGDVCFVLIGQIVNRRFLAVRYQPSGILIVNSPIETPSLLNQTRKDWSGLSADSLKASLLSDIRTDDRYRRDAALQRLHLYFPSAYDDLQGMDPQR